MTEDAEYWKKRYESMAAAATDLEERLKKSFQLVSTFEQMQKQWELDKVMQQQVIQKTLNNSNATNNSYLEENKLLKAEILNLSTLLAERSKK